jgi:hypothetical protein
VSQPARQSARWPTFPHRPPMTSLFRSYLIREPALEHTGRRLSRAGLAPPLPSRMRLKGDAPQASMPVHWEPAPSHGLKSARYGAR